ncbi:MAG: radical SAM protein [Candidatus Micrarchaeota archaeon]|nr:radical SAM protein [Candidatus Micrarchaeota archaeon]
MTTPKIQLPQLRGLDIAEEESREYGRNFIRFHETGRLEGGIVPILGIMVPPNCNYSCIYCQYGNDPTKSQEGLTEREVKGVLDAAVQLGAKTIEIAGVGEPTIWAGLPHLLREASERGLRTVIFTNGAALASNDELMKLLFEDNASLLLKFNSFKDDIQDFLCGTKRAHEWRDRSFQKAVEVGFNRETPTRLGIETVICAQNRDEILALWNFARERNVFPFFETLHATGRALVEMDTIKVSQADLKSIFEAVAHEDKRKWGYEWTPYMPYLGFSCTVYDHVIVNHDGRVASCFDFGISEGNIKKKTLVEIVKGSERLYRIRKLREEFNRFITCRDASSGEVPLKSDRKSLPIV